MDSAARRVADAVRAELLDGAVGPGTWLREEVLAQRFEVGRYTVRTALADLMGAGLLVHERHRGARVPELTREWIDEVYGFRQVIELGSLRVALEQGHDLSAVEAAVDALAALPDDAPWHEVTTAHGLIHRAIVAMAGNRRLLAAFDDCRDELHLLTSFVRPDMSAAHIAGLHRDLLAGLAAGGDAAVRALALDIEVSGRQAMAHALERHTIDNPHITGRPA